MLQLVREVRALADGYVRRGGKDNRKQQRARMLAFTELAASMGARSLGQVGGRHVIEYWRRHRDLSASTAYNHWLALCALWELAGKPPRPMVSHPDAGSSQLRVESSGNPQAIIAQGQHLHPV